MRRLYILIAIILGFCQWISAQELNGKVTNIFGDPLIGANILWQGTDHGVTTDINGVFSIENPGTHEVLVFSYIGFKSQEIRPGDISFWEIQLIEDNTIKTIEVSAKEKGTKFQDAAAKIEVIGTREIKRAACCSLAGCFSTNASVQAVTTNVVTDAKELRILGLSGVYNQILVDGLPLIFGAPYTFGTGSFPGVLIKQIYVSKGANSVLQGVESITGQINILPKDPSEEPRLFFNGFANSFGESQYNINHSAVKNKWKNFTNVHLTLPARKRDIDGDDFIDVVKTNRKSIYNKLSFNDPDADKFHFSFGTRYWNEKRVGGQIDFNENLHLGGNNVYGQTINMDQIDLYLKSKYQINDNLNLVFLNSGFFHDQNSYYGIRKYIADHKTYQSELYINQYYGESDNNIKYGFSYRSSELKEEVSNVNNAEYIGTNSYQLPSTFIENVLNLDKFTLITGLRYNKYGDFGWKIAPRILARYQISEDTDLRVSLGKGIRWSHIFSEYSNMLSSSRNIVLVEQLAPEEAYTLGTNLVHQSYFKQTVWTLSLDAYYSNFQNQIFPDFEKEVGEVYVSNFFGKSRAQSIQIENKFDFNTQFELKFSYNYQNIQREENGETLIQPFLQKHKVLAIGSFDTSDDKWQFDITYSWNGSKRLPDTSLYPEGFQQIANSPSFSLFNFQVTKKWTNFELYSGVENIFDFRQNFPIVSYQDPFGPYFDTSFNWGPTKGREYYIGFRYSIK